MRRIVIAALIMALGIVPAAAQMQAQERVAREVSDPNRTLVIREAMIYSDFAKTHAVRFTPATYVLEAEDDDYVYYRAPDQIEYRVFKNGAVVDGRFMPGGIYFNKALISLVPAGAYLTVDGTHKMLMWKLGVEFMRLEGDKWDRVNKPKAP